MNKSHGLYKKIIVIASIPLFIFSVYRLHNYEASIMNKKEHEQEIVNLAPESKDISKTDESSVIDDSSSEAEKPKKKERKLQSWAKDLLERNGEAVGWIKIPGFKNDDGKEYINFPVLQHSDNDYYLYHDIDGLWNESGSIYADFTVKIDERGQPDNIVIYGHHMRNLGTSFTHLAEYKDGVDFLKKYPIIEFNTIYDEEPEEYVIISCYVAAVDESQDENLFDYWRYLKFDKTEYKFSTWIKRTKECSWYSCDVQCDKNDEYITLSTCSNEVQGMRWVITAKKIDEDDDKNKILESYKEKDDTDIYFPPVWSYVWGNHKKYLGWNY